MTNNPLGICPICGKGAYRHQHTFEWYCGQPPLFPYRFIHVDCAINMGERAVAVKNSTRLQMKPEHPQKDTPMPIIKIKIDSQRAQHSLAKAMAAVYLRELARALSEQRASIVPGTWKLDASDDMRYRTITFTWDTQPNGEQNEEEE